MDTTNLPDNKLDSSDSDEMPTISSLSLSSSPDSPQMTPKTPEDSTCDIFGTGIDLTPTPHRFADTKAASFPGYTFMATTSKDSASTGLHHRHQRLDTAYHQGEHTYVKSISQIWAPRPTTPDRGIRIGRETPVHMRWGSLDAYKARGHRFSVQPLTRISSFIPGRRQSSNPDDMTSWNHTDQMTTAQFSQLSLGLNAHLTHDHVRATGDTNIIKPLDDASGAFVTDELRNAQLNSPAASQFHDNRRLQNLGIDVLRLAHKEYPIRQPIPAPLPIKVLPNNHVQGFLPMQAVMQQTPCNAFIPDTNIGSSKSTASSKFSSRYHGMHTETNASAEHLNSEENCALWLTNLPPIVTTQQLLSSIRNIGRIWCSYINYPDYLTHQTAAAKVVFFSPDAAQQLLSTSWTKGLYVQGYRVKISHNRIKYSSHAVVGKMSRCLIITGRADFVNENSLTKFFKDRFIFQVDEVVELIKAGGRAVVEFKFGSYRCQAQMGKMSLEKDRPVGLEKVEFGEDPCEVGDTLSSYGIAAERIQGRGL